MKDKLQTLLLSFALGAMCGFGLAGAIASFNGRGEFEFAAWIAGFGFVLVVLAIALYQATWLDCGKDPRYMPAITTYYIMILGVVGGSWAVFCAWKGPLVDRSFTYLFLAAVGALTMTAVLNGHIKARRSR